MNAKDLAFDPRAGRALRDALGCFATGVTVVTAVGADGRRAGVTVNSFASVSLEPPLVLWSLATRAPSLEVFSGAAHFAIHVLREGQEELSRRFATPVADKFEGLAVRAGLGGLPLLEDVLARFECRKRFSYYGGDHVIFVGEVVVHEHSERSPLLFYRGRYASVTAVPG